MAPRLTWLPYVVAGKPSEALRVQATSVSGAYAIRRKDSHGVVYVGESHTGRMWKTLTRHFQAPESFKRHRSKGGGANTFAVSDGAPYEVAIRVTSRGVREKAKPDQAALDLQAKWIEAFRKAGHHLHNVDDGRAIDDGTDFDFGANVRSNPAEPLTTLGLLTALSTEKDLYRWPLRNAPVLAYDETGALHIVYLERVVRPSTKPEERPYVATHWGARPDGKIWAGGEAVPPWGLRGKAVSVTYTTKKGADDRLVDYQHQFGEGGGRRRPVRLPAVVEHVCHRCGSRCAARGALALQGGSYKVTERGIVG